MYHYKVTHPHTYNIYYILISEYYTATMNPGSPYG